LLGTTGVLLFAYRLISTPLRGITISAAASASVLPYNTGAAWSKYYTSNMILKQQHGCGISGEGWNIRVM
jgi:hypothetical protein